MALTSIKLFLKGGLDNQSFSLGALNCSVPGSVVRSGMRLATQALG